MKWRAIARSVKLVGWVLGLGTLVLILAAVVMLVWGCVGLGVAALARVLGASKPLASGLFFLTTLGGVAFSFYRFRRP